MSSSRVSRSFISIARLAGAKAAIVVLATPLLMATAHAEWKGYPGSSCYPANDSADVYRSVTGGGISNSGSSSINVFCPVVRDISAGGVDRVQQARVTFSDRNEFENFTCTLRSRTQEGGLVDSKSVTRATSPIRIRNVDASNWGSYTLVCRIPGRSPWTNLQSYIISYALEEADGPQ